ncbi:MAG TPA: hypothetical protein DCP92_03490 [Nitrospiraceae bacterium]|jgi:hypothetical protein|nr:hypothetical protein [Nitrospiraceae bacterium]
MFLRGKVLTALLLISIIALFPFLAHSEGGRWKLIGRSKTDTCWYIDTESLSFSSKNIASVWVRSIPEKQDTRYGEEDESTWDIMKDLQARYFGAYRYTEGLWELDCTRGMFRILYFVAYGEDGEIINSLLDTDAGWAFIVPGSVGETIQATLCK